MKTKECKRCKGNFESNEKKLLCLDCESDTRNRQERYSTRMKQCWDKNNKFLYKMFKYIMFGKKYKVNKLDEKIIRTRIRLFKIQKKEVETDETN